MSVVTSPPTPLSSEGTGVASYALGVLLPLSSEERGVGGEVTTLLARVRLLALDIDGTLTDGAVTFTDNGYEMKTFHVHDGLGIVMASLDGLQVAWITGRTSTIVERRARELGILHLLQGIRDKSTALTELAAQLGVNPDAVAYMGDDWNDLPAFAIAGVCIAPANADAEVRKAAHYVTARSGGQGAVRDAITAILQARGEHGIAKTLYLNSLSAPAKIAGQ